MNHLLTKIFQYKKSFIFYFLLFISIWFLEGGGIQFGAEIFGKGNTAFYPFYGNIFNSKFTRYDLLAVLSFIWFFHMGYKYRFSIFERFFIPITFSFFAWIAIRKKYIDVDEVLKFIKYLLLIKASYFLLNMIFFHHLISNLTSRKEVFNQHHVFMMPILLTICFLDYYDKKGKNFINIIGMAISSLILVLSLKRTSWILFTSTVVLLIYFNKDKIFRFANVKKIAKLSTVIVLLILCSNIILNKIYKGTFEDIKKRYVSVFALFNPDIEIKERSTFGNINSLNNHLEVIKATFYNILESPILGKGNQKTIPQTFNLYNLTRYEVIGGGSHSGHLWVWLEEGLFGFILYLLLYFYLVWTALKSYKLNKNKYSIFLIIISINLFIEGMFWRIILTKPNNLIIYLFLFTILVVTTKRIDSFPYTDNMILLEKDRFKNKNAF